jgi:hypothetical protein
MKAIINWKAAVLCSVVLLSASVSVSANKNSAVYFFLPAPIVLDGAQLPEGMYQLTMESSGSAVRVSWWKDGRFVATAHGAWVKSGQKYKENSILLRVNSNGSRSLIELRVAGIARSIVLKNSGETVQFTAK